MNLQINTYEDFVRYSSQELENLRDRYFDALEEDCVEYLEERDLGFGYIDFVIRDEYLDRSIEDMTDYLINR